jgi:tetratricopeptide (TPR) repeat protein
LTHELAPSDLATARLAAEAADALMDAARARSSADARAAAGLLRRAASLTVDDPRLRAERLLRAAYVQWSALTPEAVSTLLDEVEVLGPAAGSAAIALGRALRSMIEVTTGTGAAPTSLVDTTRQAGEICADERWAWGLAVARRLEANAFNVRAEWSKIQPLLDEVVALSEAAEDPSLREEALMYGLGVARWGPAPVEEGLVLCERVITELRDAPVTRGRAMLDQDVLQAMNGAIDGALPALTQPPPKDDLISYTFWGFCASNIAELAGDDREAARIAISAADVSASSGDVAFSSTLNAYGAFLLAGLGDVSRGRELMAIARDTSPAGDAASHAFWRLAGAIVAAADGDADEARRMAAEAIEWIDGTDQINEQADVRLRVAPALRSIGDVEHARALLAEALELYGRKGNRPMTARAEQQLSEFG